MIRHTLSHFWHLRAEVRSLVFLYWIFALTGSLTGTFVQIFLFTKFLSVLFNMYASLMFFTGIVVGFCASGYLSGLFHIPIKHGFLLSLIAQGLAFVFLIGDTTRASALLFMFVFGVGNGLFWLTIHTFELAKTRDTERDIYSSLLSAGDQVFAILGPALATLLLWVSGTLLGWGQFTLLFAVTPTLFLLGFFCLSSLGDYRPTALELDDLAHFFRDKKNRLMHMFFAGDAFQHILGSSVFPLVSLVILGSALTVGLYSTLFGAVSVSGILIIAQYRTTENRIHILGIGSIILVASIIWLGHSFSLSALICFTIATSILSPLMHVSSHLINLQTIESSTRSNRDFFATMIFRDFSLWFWRMVAGALFLALTTFWGTGKEALSIGVYLHAGAITVSFMAAYLLLKKKKQLLPLIARTE